MIIENGAGNGNKAKVNEFNRLYVSAVQQTEESRRVREGNAYLLTMDTTLTTDGETALFYIENTGQVELVISAVGLNTGFSTGGVATSSPEVRLEVNPTGGTLVDAAVDSRNNNRNSGSSNTLPGLSYQGVEGNTLTGGVSLGVSFLGPANAFFQPVEMILPKGGSFGVLYKPAASNTSIDVSIGVSVYLNGEF